jgi:uncharacterized repeat protein (TIGR02543 family)
LRKGEKSMTTNSIKKTMVLISTLVFLGAAFMPAVQSQVGTLSTSPSVQVSKTEWRVQEIKNILEQINSDPGVPQSNPKNPMPLDNNPPNIHLPTSQVTMTLFTSPLSYFRNQLTNVPPGYEVHNGNYTGWCSDYAHYINLNTPYQVYLYSTYNTSLPSRLYHQNWSKVNYILNHKIGNDWHQVQYAIVYILDFGNQGLNANGWAMVNASILNGGSYVPCGGDIIAIIADPGVNIQRQIFELVVPTYTLDASVNGMGTIEKNPNQTSYTYGQNVQVTANPAVGWVFDHWDGNLSGSTNPTTISMTGSKSIIATFTQCIYTLTVNVDPAIGGSVSVVPAPPYYYGMVVTLTATGNPGYSFDQWSGDASGFSSVVSVTMDGDRSVVAHFTQDVYTLSVSVDPVVGGSVSVVPAPPYYYGMVVTLTATGNPGYSFDQWSGDASGFSSITTLTIDGDKAVTAHFTQNEYTVTIAVDPIDSGSVVVTAPPYHYGDVVTLTAEANPNYMFDYWSGDASGSTTITNITIDGNKSVTAHFTIIMDIIPPTLKIAKPINGIYLFNTLMITFKIPIVIQWITIEVNASDNQSGINRVEFSIDGTVKGNDSSAPFAYNWSEIKSGNHTISVTAYDNAGNTATTTMNVLKWRLHPIIVIPLLFLHMLKVRFGKDFWERFGFDYGEQTP